MNNNNKNPTVESEDPQVQCKLCLKHLMEGLQQRQSGLSDVKTSVRVKTPQGYPFLPDDSVVIIDTDERKIHMQAQGRLKVD